MPELQELIGVINRLQQTIDDMQRTIPLEVALWDIVTMSKYLNRDARTVRAYVKLPGFPKVIQLPSCREGSTPHGLWKASEVIEWSLTFRENTKSRRGRPRIH
jgi:hypothetical protein